MGDGTEPAVGGIAETDWIHRETSWRELWNLPLTGWQCVIGWTVATLAFLGLAEFLGGTSYPDLYESLYATQLIAHGHFACLFPGASTHLPVSIAADSSVLAPLYPLVTGGLSAILRLGHSVPFPVAASSSGHCVRALVATSHWIALSSATWPTMRLAYVSWFFLMAGVVAVLRSSGRGRRGSEPVVLFAVALLPPVFMCIGFVFHPEYLMAAGLALGAVAALQQERWLWSGALAGLAVITQQFAVLVAAVLFVAVAQRLRWRWLAGFVAAVVAIVGPLALATSGRAIAVALFGSSRVTPTASDSVRATGGTVLWELHLRGAALFGVARALPIIAALGVAWWVLRRAGSLVSDPTRLVAVVTIALTLRLVFEENLFGYYFMATAVSLVILDAVDGRFRGEVLGWIGLVTLAFNPIPSGFASRMEPWGGSAIPFMAVAFAVILAVAVAFGVSRGRVAWDLVGLLALVLVVFHSQIFFANVNGQTLPHWLWQVILVPWSLILAWAPLRVHRRERQSVP